MIVVTALALMLAASPDQPDMAGVVSLRNKFGSAHGCPISGQVALTSAHVVEPAPLLTPPMIFGGRFSSELGNEGTYRVFYVSNLEDLAYIILDPPQSRWYPLADTAPSPGEAVYYRQYSWKNDDLAYSSIIVRAKVVRLSAGGIVFSDDAPKPGASGSCLLNANGEVVGIIDSYTELENHDRVGSAVGTWGEYARRIKEVLER